jgi:hypothetical protein
MDAAATDGEATADDTALDGAEAGADATDGAEELEELDDLDAAAGTEGEEEELEEEEEDDEANPEDVDHNTIDIPNPNDTTGIDVPKAPKG